MSRGRPTGLQNIKRKTRTVWNGLLEWDENKKDSVNNTREKVHHEMQCRIACNYGNTTDANSWPTKLKMQLIPKGIAGRLEGGYLTEVKIILFHIQKTCPGLAPLAILLDTRFVGFVSFTGGENVESKALILMFSREHNSYMGFVPDNQGGFLNRVWQLTEPHLSRGLIQQLKGMSLNPAVGPSAENETLQEQSKDLKPTPLVDASDKANSIENQDNSKTEISSSDNSETTISEGAKEIDTEDRIYSSVETEPKPPKQTDNPEMTEGTIPWKILRLQRALSSMVV